MGAAVEFTARCPLGHVDATWWTALQDARGAASWDHLGMQTPGYRVECPRCDEAGPAGGPAAAPPG